MDNIDYRQTLNLPKTDFSMKAGLTQKEPQILDDWQKKDLYGKIRASRKGAKQFVLHDGPPYANGNIHIGHALNKILKDIIIKYKTLQGFDVPYTPGWDCHGLPIEHQLMKDMNKKSKSDVDAVDFRGKAHDYALKYVGIQRKQFERLGVFADWDRPYLTLNKDYEHAIAKSLARLFDKGYLYRGQKPVNWCATCETALAEAEIEYENISTQTVYVKFHVKNPENLLASPTGKDRENEIKAFSTHAAPRTTHLLIWTTTPWTLVANVAVAVNDKFNYALVDTGADCLIVEETSVDRVMARAEIRDFKILKIVKGSELTRLVYSQPLSGQDCPVVAADYVTTETGTGLVHTAPGHGADDFATGKKYNLPTLMPVNDKGVYTEGPYTGQFVFKANDQIIEDLKTRKDLFAVEKIVHSYPHCWRCKKPIIFRATHQWFLKVDHDNLREKIRQAIKTDVKWIPDAGEERILGMINTRPDWCLSRQRHWGVPIPALRPKAKDDQPRLYSDVLHRFAEIVKTEGSDAWFKRDAKDFLPAGFACPETGATEFEKTFDILDVWFDSGVSHQAVVKGMLGLDVPVDMYLEGSDQHRGWFQASIIPSCALEGRPPFRSVLTHGFVVDGEGRKMSKSLGNVVSPEEVITQSGADILRLWVASSSYNDDIRVSKEVLNQIADGYRKIRNTFRYLLSNLYDFDPGRDTVAYEKLTPVDQWMLGRLAEVMTDIRAAYDEYAFARVYKTVFGFCNEDLSNFYLDILKDRLYIPASFDPQRRSAQTVLYHVLNHLLRAMTPVLAFTSEEIFSFMPKDAALKSVESVHTLTWLEIPSVWKNEQIVKMFEKTFMIRPFVTKAMDEKRREGVIGSSLDAQVLIETSSEALHEHLNPMAGILEEVFSVSKVAVARVDAVDQGLSEALSKVRITVSHADGTKCERSWKYTTDVGKDPDYPTLSLRCARILKEMKNE